MYVPAKSVENLGEAVVYPGQMSTRDKLLFGAAAATILGLAYWSFKKSQFSAADLTAMALLDAMID